MRLLLILAAVVVGSVALGLWVHADMMRVILGLAVGGGVGGGLTVLIRWLRPNDETDNH